MPLLCIVTCFIGVWLLDGVLELMIGFIDHLFIPLRTTRKYSSIADLRTLQFTVTHTLAFSAFTTLILETDL
jgi:hypothetical protein